MPPNVVDPPVSSQENNDVVPKPEFVRDAIAESGNLRRDVQPPVTSSNEFKLKTFLSTLNLLAHLLIGAVTGITLIFAFSFGLPLGATQLHIVLCVIGYQLLMAEAILSLSADNGWSLHLRLVDKRRAHLVLQILGSGLAIAGSFIKILDKAVHWNTLHGQFALVALVFTSVSLVNGVTSLYAYEFRKFLPGNISKLTHICFGIVAFAAACISLCYGLEKGMFRTWLGDGIAYTVIAFTAAIGFLVILTPIATFYLKTKSFVGSR